jgi:DNA polymerase I-like protein with 3'-5' exonuclease and polymerase domains
MPSTKVQLKTPTELWEQTELPLACEKCGLAAKCASAAPTKFQSVGADTPQILVVLPKLADYDVACRRISLDTPEMRTLHKVGQQAGLPANWLQTMARVTVAVKCPGSFTNKQQKTCRDFLLMEIAHYRPKLVLCVGKEATQALLGRADQIPGRGRVFRLDEEIDLQAKAKDGGSASLVGLQDIRVMRLQHPAVCLDDPGLLEYMHHDLAKIPHVLSGAYQEKTRFEGRKYNLCMDFGFAKQALQYFMQVPSFSFDIEAGPGKYGLEPYSKKGKILCIAFADQWRNVYCIPLDHKDSPLREHLPELLPLLRNVLTRQDAEITAHNGKFDTRWIKLKYGFDVALGDDTMIMHGCLDENKEHDLKTLAELHTDLGYYDEELLEHFIGADGKRVTRDNRCYETHVPLEVLMRYNCADADGTEQLKWILKKQLEAQFLWTYYKYHKMPDLLETAYTEQHGIAIDTKHRDQVSVNVKTRLAGITTDIADDPWLHRWRVQRAAEFDAEGRVFLHQDTIWASYQSCLRGDTPLFSVLHQADWSNGAATKILVDKKILHKTSGKLEPYKSKCYALDGENSVTLNMASSKQLQVFLYDSRFLNLKVTKTTKVGGAPATDKNFLKQHENSFPVIKHLLEFKALIKWKSTYLDPFVVGEYVDEDSGDTEIGYIKEDGLIHPEYLLTGNDKGREKESKAKGTRTGRKSCVNPNIQNQKKRGEGSDEIYKYFISRWRDDGGLILQADFSQLELRVFAAIAGIRWMIERYQQGADLHTEMGMEAFGKTREEILANGKLLRAAAKELWFGPIYGEGWEAIQEVLAQKHGIVLSDNEAKALMKRLYDRMPEYARYKAGYESMLDQHTAVWTPFGRRRYLPTWFSREKWIKAQAGRQAGNFIIQSTGSDMLSWAIIILNRWARENAIKSKLILSVHDSVGWDVFPGEVELIAAVTRYVMEHVPFSFIRNWPVPILADVEYAEPGGSWGDVEERKRLVIDEHQGRLIQLPAFQSVIATCDRLIA